MPAVIETDKPIPAPGAGRPMRWPWPDMQVGDSIDVGGDRTPAYSAYSAARMWGVRHPVGKKRRLFRIRKTGDSWRVWRIA